MAESYVIIGKEVRILKTNQSSGVEIDSKRKDIVCEEYHALEPPICIFTFQHPIFIS